MMTLCLKLNGSDVPVLKQESHTETLPENECAGSLKFQYILIKISVIAIENILGINLLFKWFS